MTGAAIVLLFCVVNASLLLAALLAFVIESASNN